MTDYKLKNSRQTLNRIKMPKKSEPPTNDQNNLQSNSQTTDESNSQTSSIDLDILDLVKYESPTKKTKVETRSEELNFTYRVQEINGQPVAVVLIVPNPTFNKYFQGKFSYPFGTCKHTSPQCQNCHQEIMAKLSFKLNSQDFMIKNVEKFENFNGQINPDHYVNEIPTPFKTISPNWGLWAVGPKCVTKPTPGKIDL